VINGGGVTVAGGDTQAEQVGQPADVTLGGQRFVEDAVLPDTGSGLDRPGVPAGVALCGRLVR